MSVPEEKESSSFSSSTSLDEETKAKFLKESSRYNDSRTKTNV
jgi:hypothetical protein